MALTTSHLADGTEVLIIRGTLEKPGRIVRIDDIRAPKEEKPVKQEVESKGPEKK